MAVVFCDAWGYWEEAVYWASHSDRLMRRRSHWQFCCVQWAWLVTICICGGKKDELHNLRTSGQATLKQGNTLYFFGVPRHPKEKNQQSARFLETETEKEEERFQATHEVLQSTSIGSLTFLNNWLKKVEHNLCLFVCLFLLWSFVFHYVP